MKNYLQKEKNKVKRFELKYGFEQFQKKKDEISSQKEAIQSKGSHAISANSTYIGNGIFSSEKQKLTLPTKEKTCWEKITDRNPDLKSQIYKDAFDSSEGYAVKSNFTAIRDS
jgi:hypothetical protein